MRMTKPGRNVGVLILYFGGFVLVLAIMAVIAIVLT